MNEKYHKKTVLQVVPSLKRGGVERGTLEISKALVKAGYRSLVISSGGVVEDDIKNTGGEHYVMEVASKNPYKLWNNSRKLAQFIRENNVDIIHARSRAPAWSCAMAAKSTNISFITTFHGIYKVDNIFKRYYNSILTGGDKVIAISNFVCDHILKNYQISKDKIKVIHRGVNCEEYSRENISLEKQQALFEQYNVPADAKVILMPARFTSWKGHMQLIDALISLGNENFYCIMVGDLGRHPEYVEKIRQKTQKEKMQAKIQIYGDKPCTPELYSIADIVVSASIQPEAFCKNIIEAQAMEKLVIATNIGSSEEIIVDGETGFHAKANDVEDLANKIKHALDIVGTDEYYRITKAGRETAMQKFSIEKMVSSVIACYEEILKK